MFKKKPNGAESKNTVPSRTSSGDKLPRVDSGDSSDNFDMNGSAADTNGHGTNGLHVDTERVVGPASIPPSSSGGSLSTTRAPQLQPMISGTEMLTPRLTRMSSANPAAASSQPFLLSGYLEKKARWSSKFSERYFVLTHSALHYFKRGAGVELFGEERGRIPIEQVSIKHFKEEKPMFEIVQGSKHRVLRASTMEECATWKKAIMDVKAAYLNNTRLRSLPNGGAPATSAMSLAPVPTASAIASPPLTTQRSTASILPPAPSASSSSQHDASRNSSPSSSPRRRSLAAAQAAAWAGIPDNCFFGAYRDQNVLMLSVETPVDEKKRTRTSGHRRTPSSTSSAASASGATSPRSQATHVDERVIGRSIAFGEELAVGTLARDSSLIFTLADGSHARLSYSHLHSPKHQADLPLEGSDSSQNGRLTVRWTVSLAPSEPVVSSRIRLDCFLELLLPVLFMLCALCLSKPNMEHTVAYALGSIICLRMFSVASSRLLKDQRAAAARSEQVEDKLWRITIVSVTRASSSSSSSSAAAPQLGDSWVDRKHLIERVYSEKLDKRARELIETDQRKKDEKLKKKQEKKDKEMKKAADKEQAKLRKKGINTGGHSTGDDEGSPPIRALGNHHNVVALNRHASDPTMVYHPHLETGNELAPGTPGMTPIAEGNAPLPSSSRLPPPLSGTAAAASNERSTRVHFNAPATTTANTPLTRGGSGVLSLGNGNGKANIASSPSQGVNGGSSSSLNVPPNDKRGVLSSPPRDPAAAPTGGVPPLATVGTPTHRGAIEPPSPVPPRAGVPTAPGASRFPAATAAGAARPPSRAGSNSSHHHDDDEPDTDHEHEKPHNGDSESDPDDDEVNHKAKDCFGNSLHTEEWGRWGTGDTAPIKTRGITYMEKKQKVPAGPLIFSTIIADIFNSMSKYPGQALRPDSALMKHIAAQPPLPPGVPPPFYMSVNFIVPGSPGCHQVVVFQAPKHIQGFYSPSYWKMARHYGTLPDELESIATAGGVPPTNMDGKHGDRAPDIAYPSHEEGKGIEGFEHIMDEFLARDDDFRKSRFKFIPKVIESSWIVKQGVGQQPAIMGNKLTQTYHYDYKNNICEVAIDVGSSRVGSNLFRLVRGYAKSIQIDMFFLFEGQNEKELPERIMGGVRIANVDLNKARLLP